MWKEMVCVADRLALLASDDSNFTGLAGRSRNLIGHTLTDLRPPRPQIGGA